MNLEAFATLARISGKQELERVRLLAFYHHCSSGLEQFSVSDVSRWFECLNLHQPNCSRLRAKIRSSRAFVEGTADDTWRLHASERDGLIKEFPDLFERSESVTAADVILPQSLFAGTRGFVESLARQINASFENNIFDGCAVLMRRLLEILLILSYEHIGQEKDIQDPSGLYLQLEAIVANAKGNSKLKLSRDARAVVDEFRTLGNFSAHKIYYNCRRSDIRMVASSYRATIEELFYKAGLKK